jgi:hypothetical protein
MVASPAEKGGQAKTPKLAIVSGCRSSVSRAHSGIYDSRAIFVSKRD